MGETVDEAAVHVVHEEGVEGQVGRERSVVDVRLESVPNFHQNTPGVDPESPDEVEEVGTEVEEGAEVDDEGAGVDEEDEDHHSVEDGA